MGTLIGHVAPGSGFLLIGLWHLFNHIKLHASNPSSYHSWPWFPSTLVRYLELYLIMAGSWLSISMELFIGPERHQPLDPDWSIPSYHLHNFEHASISFFLFLYSFVAYCFDRFAIKVHKGLVELLAALAFAQQLLLFHLHSADHMGVEGQYHWLLQLVIFVTLVTTLLSVPYPKNFLVGFVRSFSLVFQGVWFIVMGFMLWTPRLIPKGCGMRLEEGHMVVRCRGHEELIRAKSLVNLQFSWFLAGVTVFAVVFYVGLLKKYGEKIEYVGLEQEEEEEVPKKLEENRSFVHMGEGMPKIVLER
ncbi:hypothetical protein AMTRI_Chr04g180840 [Amborella trichopoda]